MAIIVKNYSVKFKGKVYTKGEAIKDLPPAEVERLKRLGYIESGEVRMDYTGEADEDEILISELTVPEGQQYIQSINDIRYLEELLVEEGNAKDRKGIIDSIEDRIKELQG